MLLTLLLLQVISELGWVRLPLLITLVWSADIRISVLLLRIPLTLPFNSSEDCWCFNADFKAPLLATTLPLPATVVTFVEKVTLWFWFKSPLAAIPPLLAVAAVPAQWQQQCRQWDTAGCEADGWWCWWWCGGGGKGLGAKIRVAKRIRNSVMTACRPTSYNENMIWNICSTLKIFLTIYNCKFRPITVRLCK